jgi:hypothetical protein
VVAQLLVFPIGRAWEKLPRWRVPLGTFTFDVNPGRFTIKEHALIVIVSIFAELSTCNRLTGLQCVNLSTSAAYATGSLVAIISPVFWNRDYGAGFSFLYLLTTQMLGYCINCTPIFATLLTTRVDLGSPVLHEDGWSTPAHSSGPRHSLPQFCSVLCMNRKTVHLPMAGC